VPKTDSQVEILLKSRKDIFAQYNEEAFEKEFEVHFQINSKIRVFESERIIYWMIKK
jgi:hypothetical protein